MTNDETVRLEAIDRCIQRQEKSFKVFLPLTSREIRYKAEQMIVKAGYAFTWQGETLVAHKAVYQHNAHEFYGTEYRIHKTITGRLSSEPTNPNSKTYFTRQTTQMNKEQKTKLRKQFLTELEDVETEMQTVPKAIVEARSLTIESNKLYTDACNYWDQISLEEQSRQSRLLRRCDFLRGEITNLL